MATAPSSLSVAIQGIADFLDGQFGEDVVVSVDTPQRAQEQAKAQSSDVLNIFVYRLSPSGFHAAAGAADPFFVRAHALLTAFPRGQGDVAADIDLRVLGHAIRVLQSIPVIPVVLPGAASAEPGDFRGGRTTPYRIQAVMQAPGMEEINHIWTTQGAELAYRLSAGYEFALIPIEPLVHAEPGPPVRAGVYEVTPYAPPRAGERVFRTLGEEPAGRALADAEAGPPPEAPPVDWVPLALLAEGGALANARSVPAGTASVDVALAGPVGARVSFAVDWTRAGGAAAAQAAQARTIGHHRLDDPAALVSLALQDAAAGDRALITARPARPGAATPLPGAPPGMTLAVTVTP